MAGLPVIGPGFAVAVEPVIREEKCGLLVDTAALKEIARVVDWICANVADS